MVVGESLVYPIKPVPFKPVIHKKKFIKHRVYKKIDLENTHHWILPKHIIDQYVSLSLENGIMNQKVFRHLLYQDETYRAWSTYWGKLHNYKPVLFKHANLKVIAPGSNWNHWRYKNKRFVCDCFHYIKQLYDRYSKAKCKIESIQLHKETLTFCKETTDSQKEMMKLYKEMIHHLS
jgi:hypothetical protein